MVKGAAGSAVPRLPRSPDRVTRARWSTTSEQRSYSRKVNSSGGTSHCGEIELLGRTRRGWRILELGNVYPAVACATPEGRQLLPPSKSAAPCVRRLASGPQHLRGKPGLQATAMAPTTLRRGPRGGLPCDSRSCRSPCAWLRSRSSLWRPIRLKGGNPCRIAVRSTEDTSLERRGGTP